MMAPCISRMRGFQMSGSSVDSALSLSCMTRFPHASVVFADRQTVAVKGKRIVRHVCAVHVSAYVLLSTCLVLGFSEYTCAVQNVVYLIFQTSDVSHTSLTSDRALPFLQLQYGERWCEKGGSTTLDYGQPTNHSHE